MRNNEHQLGGRDGESGDATKLKKKASSHKRIWHPHSESCCAGAIMKSPPLSGPPPSPVKFPLGRGGGGGMLPRSLTSWRTLWPGLVVVAFLLVFCLGSVGGTEDWTLQCPTGCKCTWVSGKKTADCRGSHWTSIPSGLSAEVQVLEMGGITIKYLPKDAFKQVGLVNLQKVFLQNCRIERIDRDAFRDLTIMIELDLSGNLVSGIEMETFESNVRLRELKLSKNPLTKLTGSSFPPLMYLKLLDLSDCQLSTLPKKAFEKLSVLESLSLSGNRFTYLSRELLKPLTKLKSLQLAGNPWKCDCRLKTLRDWVIQKNLFQHHTRCAEPAIVSNFAWDQLVSLDFSCRPEIVSVQINGKPTDALLVHTDIGSDITLQCLVRGNPPPDLKWVRDGQVLTNNSRSYGKSYYLHIGGEEGWELEDPYSNTDDYRGRWVNLTIQKTDPEDAGEYTCVGSNSGGVVEKNLTLNFQDVPSGAGVGHGLGGLAAGAYRDTGWIWILITTLAVLVFATTLITLVCFCSRRRRVKTTRAQDLKNDGKLNGGGSGYIECPNLSSSTSSKSSKLDPQLTKIRDSPTSSAPTPRFSSGGDPPPSSLQHLRNSASSSPSSHQQQHHQQSQTHPPCPTSSLAQTGRHGKSVTVPCSADVELTYRINPMHCTNNSPANSGGGGGMGGTYTRRPTRCTFQREDSSNSTSNGPSSSSTFCDSSGQYQPIFHHEMIELHPPSNSSPGSRIGVLDPVTPSSQNSGTTYFHHHHHHPSPYNNPSAEMILVSQQADEKEIVLPPPLQFGPSRNTACCTNMQQQYEHCCGGYVQQNHGHHHHPHVHPHNNNSPYPQNNEKSTRFENDNLVVMSRTTECQIPSPPSSLVPVHSFCPSNYASISRSMRLPEKVPPPPPQRDLTTYATLSCNYNPLVDKAAHLSSAQQQQSPSGSSSSYNTRAFEQQQQKHNNCSERENNSMKCGDQEESRSSQQPILTQNQITKETQTGGGGGGEDQPNQRQLLLTPSSRSPGSGKVGDEDGTTMLLMKEKYLVGPDARSQSVDIITSSPYPGENGSVYRPSSAQMMAPPPPSHALTGGPHGGGPSSEYPDLLDLPHTRFQESPAPSTTSTLPDSTRMLITPQGLNPSIVVNPSRLGYNHPQAIYSNGGGGRPSFGLPFSPAEQPAFVPAGMRPGYVTLPRRHRVPSWSPGPSSNFDPASSPMGPPSPTGSAATISLPFVKARPKYDNLGPRTTADGSSRLSLDNLPGNGGTSTPNFHPHPGLIGGTLGRHNVLRSTPTPSMLGQPISHFAPIQEVEHISSPVEVDNDEEAPISTPSDKHKPSTKTDRTPTPSGSRGSSPTKGKKVPPKPPPKPVKKNVNANPAEISNGVVTTTPPEKINDPSTAIAGDDGTEV
ncbi:Leucine-rich repeat-containing protein 24 [Folsomia candida]|uniref:Leucine-rich repeat-containing protein 24 n=1 Tax=Folsomia candida TaxID=158441 RepID=A0A226DMC1_FOLCA|nr:Leucine-rich repeat-containing protein 24 [Folsomia candida]